MVYAVSVWVSPKHPLCQNSNRKGLQWADTNATLVAVYVYKGAVVYAQDYFSILRIMVTPNTP